LAKPIPKPKTPAAGPYSTRVDARRNYDRLLNVAHEVFDERGANASLEEIARRAGLGSATLHRHFPSRYALMAAVYWNQIEALCAAGRDLVDAKSSGDALTAWLRQLIAVAAERGLATALMTSRRDATARLFDACHDAIRAAGAPLLARAKQAGAIRADVELEDVLQLANAIALTVEHDSRAPERVDRLLSLLIDGLRGREANAGK
jgi:AcrR family transcriptional regulator